MNESSAPDQRARSEWGRVVQRFWLAALFLLGFGFIVLIPPFQTIDEVAHWDRVWTVADGKYNCWTLPTSAAQFVEAGFRFDNGPHSGPIPWSLFGELYAFRGDEGEFWIATSGCHYPPIGYALPALAARLLTKGPPSEPHPHKMFVAFYASRTVNWLLFFACVVAAYRVGRYPMVPLVFASIPMVVHQAVSINNDAFQFGGLLLTGALLSRAPTRRTLWSAIVIVTLMSMIKPINAAAVPLIWIAGFSALRSERVGRVELTVAAVTSLALPIAAWQLWQATMHVTPLGLTTGHPVADVNGTAQLALMQEHPTHVLKVVGWQLAQIFDASPINGGWRGILLALGWYRHLAPNHVYWLALVTLLTGLLLLRWDAEPAASAEPVPTVLVLGVLGATAVYFVVITLVLYVYFTPVGAPVVFGVQGRYLLYPIALLFFLHALARRRPPWLRGPLALQAACLFVGLAISSQVAALLAIRQLFWQAS
jgi:hypothetical protein